MIIITHRKYEVDYITDSYERKPKFLQWLIDLLHAVYYWKLRLLK